MIVVDSSVWIAWLRGLDSEPVRKLEHIEDTTSIIVGDLVLAEVLQGARDDQHAKKIEALLRKFNIASMVDHQLAVISSRNYRRLRGIGVTPRGTIDVLIATFCIEGQHTLLHGDRDFGPFSTYLGLRRL